MPNKTASRLTLTVCLLTILLVQSDSAWAFDSAGQQITSSVCQAVNVTRKVLTTAATLAVMVGIAPMLWGEVKVKWLISSAVFCAVINLVGAVVAAFAGTGSPC